MGEWRRSEEVRRSGGGVRGWKEEWRGVKGKGGVEGKWRGREEWRGAKRKGGVGGSGEEGRSEGGVERKGEVEGEWRGREEWRGSGVTH